MRAKDYMAICTERGYKCEDESGVLTFVLSMEEYRDKEKFKEIRKFLKEIGYDHSWGTRPERKKTNDSEKLQESK